MGVGVVAAIAQGMRLFVFMRLKKSRGGAAAQQGCGGQLAQAPSPPPRARAPQAYKGYWVVEG